MSCEDVFYALGLALAIIIYLYKRVIWESYFTFKEKKKPHWYVITIIIVVFCLYSFM